MENEFVSKLEKIMNLSMENLKSVIDVDIVVGKPIFQSENLTIIPLTKVLLGYVSGGGEYNSNLAKKAKKFEYPFAGGSGSGINLKPIGFLIVKGSDVSVVKLEEKSAVEKLIEAVPEIASMVDKIFGGDKNAEN